MAKKEKSYTFDQYMDKFSPDTCKECRGSGVEGSLPLGTLRPCSDCDGTGRKDKRALREIARRATRKIRVDRL